MTSAKRRRLAGLGRRQIVVASLSDAPTLLADARRAVKDGADLLEVRADFFPKSLLKPEPLRSILGDLKKAVKKPLLLTLRLHQEGGGLSRAFRDADRLALFRAALSEVAWVDVELADDDINYHVVSEAHKRGRSVILSSHFFMHVPPDGVLRGLAKKARRLGADIFKVAALPKRPADVDRLMNFCRVGATGRRVFIPMGPLGTEMRKQAFHYKSCLTFGYVRKPTAPGQVSVKELIEVNL
jgi:3-dehydroquinate dehydratase-1